jgi:hypothetical protein
MVLGLNGRGMILEGNFLQRLTPSWISVALGLDG